jgi:hypothetical protein
MRQLILASLFLLSSVAYAHGISEADKAAMLNGGNLQYIWLGATHMLSGYDHLLFLFGVIFFLTNTKDIVRFVSVFTIGHSITLIFATFMGIKANYYLIDAVIALSVIYKAFDNNKGFQSYFGMKQSPNILAMVLIFGLIHGFGLSTRLQQLPLGDQGSDMLLRIISFNIGVELGQILALIVMLIVLTGLRKLEEFNRYSKIANHFLMFLGTLLLLMQLHGYLHQTSPEENWFDKKTHGHIHEDIEIEKMKRFELK